MDQNLLIGIALILIFSNKAQIVRTVIDEREAPNNYVNLFKTYSSFDIGIFTHDWSLSELPALYSEHQIFLLQTHNTLGLSKFLNSISSRTIGSFAIVFSPSNISEATTILSELVQFYDISQTAWKPYFFITVPVSYIYINNETFSALLMLAKRFSVGAEVYLIFQNNSTQEGSAHISISGIEIYGIRNQSFVNDLLLNGSLDFHLILAKSSRRSNFHLAPVTGISVDDPGYELATDYDDNNVTIEFIGGFEVEEFWFLRDAMNFTEIASKSKGYVREGPNGTLTGMAVEINKGQADVAISATEFLEYRVKAPEGFSYLHPTFHNRILAFFKQPPASSIRDVFLSTFSIGVWMILLAVWILFVSTMYFVRRITRGQCTYTSSKDIQIFEDKLIMAVSMVCQQGWHISPRSMSLRIIFFSGWTMGLLVYVAYSAALVSILSTEVVPINSFADILEEKFFIYSDSHIPTTKFVIKELELRKLIPTVSEKVRNIEVADTIRRIVKGRSAVVTISDSFYPILRKRGYNSDFACNVLSKVYVSPTPLVSSMFVKKRSPLKEFFNNKILLMQESGIKHRLMSHYILESSIQCLETKGSYKTVLGIKDVFTAYVILTTGFVVCTLILLIEKMCPFGCKQCIFSSTEKGWLLE